jgi:hypothetical protein
MLLVDTKCSQVKNASQVELDKMVDAGQVLLYYLQLHRADPRVITYLDQVISSLVECQPVEDLPRGMTQKEIAHSCYVEIGQLCEAAWGLPVDREATWVGRSLEMVIGEVGCPYEHVDLWSHVRVGWRTVDPEM